MAARGSIEKAEPELSLPYLTYSILEAEEKTNPYLKYYR